MLYKSALPAGTRTILGQILLNPKLSVGLTLRLCEQIAESDDSEK